MFVTDNVIRENKKFYPQKFLEECQYKIKRTKMENFINDDLDKFKFIR